MLALRARSPCLFARGRCPLCTPFVGAQLPKQVARLGFYPQSGGRSAPPTPGDFLPDEKVTKESPRGGHPLWVLPLGGIIIPPAARRAAPPRKGCNSGQHASHKATAAPRIDSRECDSRCSLGRKKDRFAHQLKVANRFIFVAEALSRGCGNRRGSEASPLGDSKGHSPWRAFGDFPRDGKVTRVQGGAPASRGCGGAAPTLGSAEGQHPSQKTNPGTSRWENGRSRSAKSPPASAVSCILLL